MNIWKIRSILDIDFKNLTYSAFWVIGSILFLWIGIFYIENKIITQRSAPKKELVYHKINMPIKKELVFHKIKYPYEGYVIKQKIDQSIESPKPDPEVMITPKMLYEGKITKGSTPNSITINNNIEIFYKEIKRVLDETPQGFK